MQEHVESHQEQSEGHSPPHPQRGVTGPILLLVGIAGYFDAISYLGLGHVFTANMTGNTVLLALNIGQRDLSAVLLYLCALGGFCLGVWCGALLVGQAPKDDVRIRAMTRVGVVEGSLMLIFAVLWLVTGTKPSGDVVPALLGLASMAMGLQSAIVRSIGLTGIATTTLTSPLATLMTELALRIDFSTHTVSQANGAIGSQAKPRDTGRLAAVWLIYGLAALVGGVALTLFPSEAVFLPLIALLVAILDAFRRKRFQGHFSTTGERTEGRP
jgi:uncharacterized membrane protein YoaK (UPF0700 family)